MAVKRGDAARESAKNTIINAFAATGDYVATLDKKIYVTAKDGPNGEVIQFAISMTMPKVPVEPQEQSSDTPVSTVSETFTELSAPDKQKVAELMQKLGISD